MATDILARFWDYYVEKTKSYDISDYTARHYVRLVKAYIKHFPQLRLKQHRAEHVEKYLQDLTLDSRQASLELADVVQALKIFFQDVVRFPWAGGFAWGYWQDLADTLQEAPVAPLGDKAGEPTAPSSSPAVELLSHDEVRRLFTYLRDPALLIARIIYGCGLRPEEAIRLRVFDIDFEQAKLLVRNDDGSQDRIVPLPGDLLPALREQLINVEITFAEDLAKGYAGVWLPPELLEKHPKASRELRWQYLFASELTEDSEGSRTFRYHYDPEQLEQAITQGAQLAGIHRNIQARSLRDSFAAHLVDAGHDLYAVGKLLGEDDISSVMIVVPKPVQDYFTIEAAGTA